MAKKIWIPFQTRQYSALNIVFFFFRFVGVYSTFMLNMMNFLPTANELDKDARIFIVDYFIFVFDSSSNNHSSNLFDLDSSGMHPVYSWYQLRALGQKKRKKGKKRQMRDMSDYIFLFNFASVMLSIGGCYISHTFVPCSIWIHRFSNCQPYYLHLCTMGTHFFSLSLSTFSKESATTTKKSSAILLFWSVCFVHVPLHPFRPIVRSIYTLCTPFQS